MTSRVTVPGTLVKRTLTSKEAKVSTGDTFCSFEQFGYSFAVFDK